MKSEELYGRIFGAIAGGGNVELTQEEAINLYGELLVLRGEDKWASVDERCRYEDCKTKRVSRGLCHSHYLRAQETGEFGGELCLEEGCAKYASSRRLCRRHYDVRRRQGIALPPGKREGAATHCDECERPAKAIGKCMKHYMRARRKK